MISCSRASAAHIFLQARLTTANRPEEVTRFIRVRRQLTKAPTIPPSKLRPYSASWVSWWKVLQPGWRNVSQWPLAQELDSESSDWTPLLLGGHNGLYLVVVSLGWWILGASKISQENPAQWTQVLDAATDVDWVFQHLLSQASRTSPLSQKRAGVDDSSPSGKKSRNA